MRLVLCAFDKNNFAAYLSHGTGAISFEWKVFLTTLTLWHWQYEF
ncbi:hypothetical protein [Holospora undulata]|nr:hypothetical protein [Holospora undulata]